MSNNFGSVGSVSVSYATKDGTALNGPDYAGTAGTITFADGDTNAKTVTIPVNDDALDEEDETLGLTLSAATGGASLGPQNAAVMTISDDDAAPSISIDDTVITEAATGTFTVRLSQASGQIVKVNYATANGTAQAGTDYQSASGTLTFEAGQTTKTVTVRIVGDTKDEPTETFLLSLSSPLNVTISDATATCTVHDNDSHLHHQSLGSERADRLSQLRDGKRDEFARHSQH